MTSENSRSWVITHKKAPEGLISWYILRENNQNFVPRYQVEEPLFTPTQPSLEEQQVYIDYLVAMGLQDSFNRRVAELTHDWEEQENYPWSPEDLASSRKLFMYMTKLFTWDWFNTRGYVSDKKEADPLLAAHTYGNEEVDFYAHDAATRRYGGVNVNKKVFEVQRQQLVSMTMGFVGQAVGELFTQALLDIRRGYEANKLKPIPKNMTDEMAQKYLSTRNGRSLLIQSELSEEALREMIYWMELSTLEDQLMSAKAYTALFDYCACFNVEEQTGKTVESMELERSQTLRETWVNRYLWLRAYGHVPKNDIARLLYFEMYDLGFDRFLKNFKHKKTDLLMPGLNAEIIAAVDLLEKGYEVRLATEAEDRLQCDLVATKDGVTSFVQVKGHSQQFKVEAFEIQQGRPNARLIDYDENNANHLRHLARERGGMAVWINSPSNIAEYCRYHGLKTIKLA